MDTLIISKLMIYILLFFHLLSCSQNKPDSLQEEKNNQIKTFNNVIYSTSSEYYFSSTEEKDQFKIELLGDDILSGQVNFKILTSQSKLIFSTTFAASDLLGFEIDANAKKVDKEKFIVNRLNHFFDKTNFIEPAIDSEEYDPNDYDIIDFSVWNEIKNANSKGFYYILGEENMIWIVFLKSQSKVIEYKSCC